MANERTIWGNNAILQILISGTYYDVFCAKSFSLDWVQDEIEKTSINSGTSREYMLGMGSGTCSVSGVTKIDNTEGETNYLYFFQLAVRRSELPLRVYLESQDGTTKQITFTGIITGLGLTGDVEQFSQSTMNIRITGDPTIEDVDTPPGLDEFDEIDLTLSEGATSVTNTILDNVEVYLVTREDGIYYETTGTPVGAQFKYSDASNAIEFDANLPGNAGGERVHIFFKYL